MDVNRIGCVMFVVCSAALTAGTVTSTVSAQEKCVPVKIGEWECDLQTFAADVEKCPSPATGENRDPFWQRPNSEAKAIQFLKAKYDEFGDVISFSRWMSCQGFHVDGDIDRSIKDFVKKQRLGSVWARFDRKKFVPFKLNGLNPLTWTSFYDYQAFVIELDQSGQLKGIRVIEPL